MHRRLILASVTAAILALSVSIGVVSAESQRVLRVQIELSGANEVPPADPDASGTAFIFIVPALDLVCWSLSWEDVDGTVVAAHIHGPAPVGVNAPVLVPLSTNPASGCAVDTDADAIAADPSNYYVNVHSTVYPAGAIRGQLG